MDIAFLIYRFFPFGGQQRNMLAMAEEARDRGHRVQILCHIWEGERPDGVEIVHVPVNGWSNHTRMRRFADAAHGLLDRQAETLRVGFIKLPRLHVYYAADPCFAEKALNQRGVIYRLLPRTKGYLSLEADVFSRNAATHILEVSRRERESFIAHYGTQPERFHTLIPGISRNRAAPPNYPGVRREKRLELGFSEDDKVLLALGSGFRTKGLDRSINVLVELRRRGVPAHLIVVGQDNPEKFVLQAKKSGVADSIQFLGGRNDVPQILQATDLLLHPAYRENTGNGLLEGMVAGIPVIATQTCGYSHFVSDWQMGEVIADDADTEAIADCVDVLWQIDSDEWHRRGQLFATKADIYDRSRQCVDLLEELGGKL